MREPLEKPAISLRIIFVGYTDEAARANEDDPLVRKYTPGNND
jgi:hypothetical protein